MKRAALAGVRITQGPSDWQILQRKLDNTVDIPLTGTWLDPANRMATVEVRPHLSRNPHLSLNPRHSLNPLRQRRQTPAMWKRL